MEPVFERRTEAERLTLWHVLEPHQGTAGAHHNLFPDEETARAYAATLPECQVYPHTVRTEQKRVFLKRKPGRPMGATDKAPRIGDDQRKSGHEITLTDAAWEYAQKQGNASQYIEALLLAAKAAKNG